MSKEIYFLDPYLYKELTKKSKTFAFKFISPSKARKLDLVKEFKTEIGILKNKANPGKSILKNPEPNSKEKQRNNVRFAENVKDNENTPRPGNYKGKLAKILGTKSKPEKIRNKHMKKQGSNNQRQRAEEFTRQNNAHNRMRGMGGGAQGDHYHGGRGPNRRPFGNNTPEQVFNLFKFINDMNEENYMRRSCEDSFYNMRSSSALFSRDPYDNIPHDKSEYVYTPRRNTVYSGPKVVELDPTTANPIFHKDPFGDKEVLSVFSPHLVNILENIRNRFEYADDVTNEDYDKLMEDALKKFQNVEFYKSPLATQENINKYLKHVKLELWCNNVFFIVTKRRSTLVEFTIFKVEIIELEIERIKYINRENKIVYSTERGLLDMNDEEEEIISNLLYNTIYTLLQDECMTKFSDLETKAMLFSKIKCIIEKEILKGNLSNKEVAILDKYNMFPSIVIYILERELFIIFDEDDCLIANVEGFPKLFASIQTSCEKSKSQFLDVCCSFLRQYRHVLE